MTSYACYTYVGAAPYHASANHDVYVFEQDSPTPYLCDYSSTSMLMDQNPVLHMNGLLLTSEYKPSSPAITCTATTGPLKEPVALPLDGVIMMPYSYDLQYASIIDAYSNNNNNNMFASPPPPPTPPLPCEVSNEVQEMLGSLSPLNTTSLACSYDVSAFHVLEHDAVQPDHPDTSLSSSLLNETTTTTKNMAVASTNETNLSISSSQSRPRSRCCSMSESGSETSSAMISSNKKDVSHKPFICHLCDRPFSRKHDLHRHVRVHTGAKPYQCPCCQKSFGRTDALKRHLRLEDACRLSPEVQAMKGAGQRRFKNL